MDHIKTKTGHILLILFLAFYGLEVISLSLTAPVIEQISQSEVPFDAEEEKDKNEKEWDDEIVFTVKNRGALSKPLSHQFGQSYNLQNIPLEIVTPPPECRL